MIDLLAAMKHFFLRHEKERRSMDSGAAMLPPVISDLLHLPRSH